MPKPIEAVLFDWGGTLMVEFPEYSGPMASWPKVEACPGAVETLESLYGRVQLGVVTNADNSGAPLVREALRRVGLDQYIEVILTPKECGTRKPDPRIFQQALSSLGISPTHAVMVGDYYAGDIQGAKAAGMDAVWLNRDGLLPETNHPAYDVEIATLFELDNALENLRLPDIQTCLDLLAEYAAPQRLIDHSMAVAGAAYHLAAWLRLKGVAVDPLLVHRGGLLHDLDKLASHEAGRAHGEMSAEILTGLGWSDLGEIARRHIMDKLWQDGEEEPTWEQKLVFYADKLVEGSRLVPVPTRLTALRKRYPAFVAKIAAAEPRILALEHEICTRLGKTPEEVLEQLESNSSR